MWPLVFGPPVGNELAIGAWLIGILAMVWILVTSSRWIARTIWKEKARMQNALKEYRTLLSQVPPRLLSISDHESSVHPSPDKWSKKEILGHLIDSASNNHQRFVRAQLGSEIRLPEYDQESWVQTQAYQEESWENLVQLWKVYNLHLLHIAAAIPDDKLGNLCFIGEKEPVTLEFLFADYVQHLKHHLQQIFG